MTNPNATFSTPSVSPSTIGKSSRQLSCGLLVICPAGILLAHATRTPRWDLPKGKLEPNETPLEAALRECQEETGLDLSEYADQMVDMGAHPYLPRKDLHLFRLDLEEPLDLSGCGCSTYIRRGENGDRYPETDDYAWVPKEEVFTRVGKSLMNYLVAREVLTLPQATLGRPKPMGRKRR